MPFFKEKIDKFHHIYCKMWKILNYCYVLGPYVIKLGILFRFLYGKKLRFRFRNTDKNLIFKFCDAGGAWGLPPVWEEGPPSGQAYSSQSRREGTVTIQFSIL